MSHRLRHLLLVLLSTLPAVVQAQFIYWSTGKWIIIGGYTGPGGDVSIPSVIDGLPVIAISDQAFMNQTNRINVTIPDSVTSIGDSAFRWCDGLQNVVIGNGVTAITEHMFDGCINLTNATIGDNVSTIGFMSFQSCQKLATVTFGRRLAHFENAAFLGCYNLRQIDFRGNRPQFESFVFDGVPPGMKVYYVPGNTGWGTSLFETFDGFPTRPWLLPKPLILSFVPSFGVQTNAFGFRVSWATNVPLVVESSTNLGASEWLALATNTPGSGIPTNGWFYFSDPEWTSYPNRIYRVRSQ